MTGNKADASRLEPPKRLFLLQHVAPMCCAPWQHRSIEENKFVPVFSDFWI